MSYTKLTRESGVMAAVLAVFLAAGAGPALAHQTFRQKTDVKGIDGALVLPRADVASSVYGTLGAAGDVNFIRLDVKGPMDVTANLFVPREKKFADFYPTYALVGPGLPAPTSVLPFALPAGNGAIVINGMAVTPRPGVFDYTTMTSLYKGIPELERRVETPGTYYIAVWAPACNFGDYLVVLGGHRDLSARSVYDSYRVVATARTGGWGTVRGEKCSMSENTAAPVKEEAANARCNLTVVPRSVNSTGLNSMEPVNLNLFGLKCG